MHATSFVLAAISFIAVAQRAVVSPAFEVAALVALCPVRRALRSQRYFASCCCRSCCWSGRCFRCCCCCRRVRLCHSRPCGTMLASLAPRSTIRTAPAGLANSRSAFVTFTAVAAVSHAYTHSALAAMCSACWRRLSGIIRDTAPVAIAVSAFVDSATAALVEVASAQCRS